MNGYIKLYVQKFGIVAPLGRALIWGDGSVELMIPHSPVQRELEVVPGVYIWEKYKPISPVECSACFIGFCDLEPPEKNCPCCKGDHLAEEVECLVF